MDIPIYYNTALQYGIFIALTALIIGYVDKKKNVLNMGWGVMILIGLFGLYLVLPMGGLNPGSAPEGAQSPEFKMWLIGLQAVLLGVVAVISFFTVGKKKSGRTFAIITVLLAIAVFFQSYNFSRSKKQPDQVEETVE